MEKWQKVGATVVSKPSQRGSGLTVRIPKNVAEAYALYSATKIEFEIKRAKRPEEGED